MQISKEKRKKLDDRVWQKIFVDYETDNQYRIYDSSIDNVQMTKNVIVDENEEHEIDDFWTEDDDKMLDLNENDS